MCDDVIRSAPDCSVATPETKRITAGRLGHNRNRFNRLFEPLKRCQSAGNQVDLSPDCYTASAYRHSAYTVSEPGHNSVALTAPTSHSQFTVTTDTSAHQHTNKKKSLKSEVCDKFHVLRRRCIELTFSSRDASGSKPTSPDTVLSWTTSLNALLADKFGRQCFREFLKSEFSEENVEFWIACEDFKQLNTPNLAALAQKIFSEFIAHQAPREINIDSVTRDLMYSNMAASPNLSMFEPAQRRIQALMDKDSYPRFLQSDLYQYLLHSATPAGT